MRRNNFVHRWSRIDDRVGARPRGRVRSAADLDLGLDQLAIRLVVRQAPGPVEHGQGPIRIFMDPHGDLHIMEPVGILWDLQTQALIAHGVVLSHDPLFSVSPPVGSVPLSSWPSLRDHPKPDRSRAPKTGQMMCSLYPTKVLFPSHVSVV